MLFWKTIVIFIVVAYVTLSGFKMFSLKLNLVVDLFQIECQNLFDFKFRSAYMFLLGFVISTKYILVVYA